MAADEVSDEDVRTLTLVSWFEAASDDLQSGDHEEGEPNGLFDKRTADRMDEYLLAVYELAFRAVDRRERLPDSVVRVLADRALQLLDVRSSGFARSVRLEVLEEACMGENPFVLGGFGVRARLLQALVRAEELFTVGAYDAMSWRIRSGVDEGEVGAA